MYSAITPKMSDEQPPSLVNHNCQYCQVKNDVLRDKSGLKFQPTNLQQQILLEIGNRTNGRKVDGKLPLPPLFVEEIKAIHQELDRWLFGIWNLGAMVDQQSTGTIREPTQIFCFYDQVHWTREMKIDRHATARMILGCLRSYADPDQINAFLLAVVHCQESDISYFWSKSEVMTAFEAFVGRGIEVLHPKNPMLQYWVLKSHGRPNNYMLQQLNCMNNYSSLHPMSDDEWLNALQFLWSDIVRSQGDNMDIWLRDAVSSAIEGKCLQVASYIWDQVPIEKRFHTVSADNYVLWKKVVENGHCEIFREIWDSVDASSQNVPIISFYSAVKGGHRQIVDDLWEAMNNWQRRTILNMHPDIFTVAIEVKCLQSAIAFWTVMNSTQRTWILDNHVECFCTAAEFGNLDLVTAMWGHAEIHQFRLAFEDSCAAFRKSCANGHVEIVRLLWEWASLDQRLHMLAHRDGDALSSAFRNGQIQVVQFLWHNMHSDAIVKAVEGSYVNEKALSTFICKSCSVINSDGQLDSGNFLFELYEHGPEPFASPTSISVLLNALLWKEASALKVLLARAEKTGNWEGITALLCVFNDKQKAQLRPKMASCQAEKCGLFAVETYGTPIEENEEEDDDDYGFYDLIIDDE